MAAAHERTTGQVNGETAGPYDYVIIGGGTAGCLLANRLSADPGKRVLLLEAGGRDNYHWVHIPVGYLYCFGNPRTDWGYQTAPEPGLNGRSLAYARGRILGGCSSINGMIYMRGQARDFDHWRQLGNPGWAWDDLLPYFKRHEDTCRAAGGGASRQGRGMAHRAPALVLGGAGRLRRRRRAGGHPAHQRFQSRQQRGRRLFRGQPAPWFSLECGEGVSAARP